MSVHWRSRSIEWVSIFHPIGQAVRDDVLSSMHGDSGDMNDGMPAEAGAFAAGPVVLKQGVLSRNSCNKDAARVEAERCCRRSDGSKYRGIRFLRMAASQTTRLTTSTGEAAFRRLTPRNLLRIQIPCSFAGCKRGGERL